MSELNEEILEDDISEERLITSSEKYPCRSCGGSMTFSPTTGSLECEYCGQTVNIEASADNYNEYSLDDAEDLASHNWGEEKRVINCESCSGQTVISISEVSKICVFCGSAHVVVMDEKQGIKPELLIPFKIANEDARKNITSWVKGKFYAPKALKNKQNVDRLKSVYIPFFTYDSDSHSAYSGLRGTHYYVTKSRTVNGKRETYRERKTRWSPVSGVYKNYYDDVLINASTKVESSLIDRMNGFNLSELEDYNPAYLAGHVTERYQITLNDGWIKARDDIDGQIKRGIRKQVGGDEFRLLHKTTDYGDVLFKHIILPVWITSYDFKGKIYNVYINGQTGNVEGKYPKDWFKILLTVLAIVIVILLVYVFAIDK